MPNLINRSACKKSILEISDRTRAKKFTRVSSDVFEHLESILKNELWKVVKYQPSVGKTIMMNSKTRKQIDDENTL